MAGSPAGALDDVGADFCAKGVLSGDLVVCQDAPPTPTASHRTPSHAISRSAAPWGCACPRQHHKLMSTSALVLWQSSTLRGHRRHAHAPSARLHLDEVPKTALNRVAATATGEDADCQPTADHRPSGTDDPGFQWQQVWPNENFQALREGLWLCDPARGDYG